MNSKIRDKIAVLVVSCDKYSDLWDTFFGLFARFWSDCPLNVYLLSNYEGASLVSVRNILIGKDLSWSDNLKNALKTLKEDYVLLFMEDLFLYDFVDTNKIMRVFDWIIKSNANYVRMISSPKPNKAYNDLVGIVSKGAIYRIGTQMPVIKKELLLDLLKSGESAWDFEVHGSVRSDKYDDFYSVWEDHFPVIEVVVKGKWDRSAVQQIHALGVKIDLGKRDLMTFSEQIIYHAKCLRSTVFNIVIPSKYQRTVKHFVIRGRYDYNKEANSNK